MKTELLLHIPHSSYFIPEKYKDLFLINKDELRLELLKMSDTYTDELFNLPKTKQLVFPVSRLICDVERFRKEEDEEMTRQGMWVCYTKTSNLTPLKIITEEHKTEILKRYYDKHHSLFNKEVACILSSGSKCLIVDCHSFSSKTLPYELHNTDSRPDICIGVDDFHTPNSIINIVKNEFTKLGYTVQINHPFKGTIVPLNYYCFEKNVESIMLEINRRIYMNETTGKKLDQFGKIHKDIKMILTKLKYHL